MIRKPWIKRHTNVVQMNSRKEEMKTKMKCESKKSYD